MKTQINYEIKNIYKELIEKGNVEISLKKCVEYQHPTHSPYVPPIHDLLKKCAEFGNGEKYEYKYGEWRITVNPDEK